MNNRILSVLVLSAGVIISLLFGVLPISAQENYTYNVQLPLVIPEYPSSKPVTFIQVPYSYPARDADRAIHEQTDTVYYNARLAPADHQQLSDQLTKQLVANGWEKCSTSFIDNPPLTQEHATYFYKEVDRQGWSLFVNAANSQLQTANGSGGSSEFPGKYLYILQKSTLTCDKQRMRVLPISPIGDTRLTPAEQPDGLLLPTNLKDSKQGLTPNLQKVYLFNEEDSQYFEKNVGVITEGTMTATTGLYWSDKTQLQLRDELISQYEAAGWERCKQESDLTRFGKPAELVIFKKQNGEMYNAVQFSTYELPDHEKGGYYNWGPYGLSYYWYQTTGGCDTIMPRIFALEIPEQSATAMKLDAVGENMYEFVFRNKLLIGLIFIAAVALLIKIHKRK